MYVILGLSSSFGILVFYEQGLATKGTLKVANLPVPSQSVLSTETILTPSDAEYITE